MDKSNQYLGAAVRKAFAAPPAPGDDESAEPRLVPFEGVVDGVRQEGTHKLYHVTYSDGDQVRRARTRNLCDFKD